MDNEVFHFEDDDYDYQSSNDEYSDELESEPWENRSRRSTNPEEQASRATPADQFLR